MSADVELHRVLSVEDEDDTVVAIVGALEDAGVEVVPARDIAEARKIVAATAFDLMLIDARMPDGTELRHSGGLDFVRAVKRHEYGSLNSATLFMVVTSYLHEIDQTELVDVPGFLGVVSKTSSTIEDIQDRLGIPLPRRPSPTEELHRGDSYEVEDLLVVTGFVDANGRIDTAVGAWPGDEPVPIVHDDLPEEVQQELQYGDRPVYVWAKVNVAAETADEVRPHAFRLWVADPAEGEAFDRGTAEDDKRV